MPRVSTERYVLHKKEPEEFMFSYTINVDTEGIFSTTLPKDVVQLFKSAGVDTHRNRIGNEGYICADTAVELKKRVDELCQEYMSRELTSEKIVIRYIIQTTCSYCIDEGGDIVPNGSWLKEYTGTSWKQGTVESNATHHKPFGILVYAKPFWRRDYKYRSGKTKTEYKSFSAFGSSQCDEKTQYHLAWLEGLTSIATPEGEPLQEIDYDENVAAFFVNMLKSICSINEKIKDFLKPEAIKMLADKKANLLGNGKS